MKKSIWKFPINETDRQTISIPQGAEILSVNLQYGHITLWALVSPGKPLTDRVIEIFGTGNPIPESSYRKFIGTVLMFDNTLVWHVFEGLSE